MILFWFFLGLFLLPFTSPLSHKSQLSSTLREDYLLIRGMVPVVLSLDALTTQSFQSMKNIQDQILYEVDRKKAQCTYLKNRLEQLHAEIRDKELSDFYEENFQGINKKLWKVLSDPNRSPIGHFEYLSEQDDTKGSFMQPINYSFDTTGQFLTTAMILRTVTLSKGFVLLKLFLHKKNQSNHVVYASFYGGLVFSYVNASHFFTLSLVEREYGMYDLLMEEVENEQVTLIKKFSRVNVEGIDENVKIGIMFSQSNAMVYLNEEHLGVVSLSTSSQSPKYPNGSVGFFSRSAVMVVTEFVTGKDHLHNHWRFLPKNLQGNKNAVKEHLLKVQGILSPLPDPNLISARCDMTPQRSLVYSTLTLSPFEVALIPHFSSSLSPSTSLDPFELLQGERIHHHDDSSIHALLLKEACPEGSFHLRAKATVLSLKSLIGVVVTNDNALSKDENDHKNIQLGLAFLFQVSLNTFYIIQLLSNNSIQVLYKQIVEGIERVLETSSQWDFYLKKMEGNQISIQATVNEDQWVVDTQVALPTEFNSLGLLSKGTLTWESLTYKI